MEVVKRIEVFEEKRVGRRGGGGGGGGRGRVGSGKR